MSDAANPLAAVEAAATPPLDPNDPRATPAIGRAPAALPFGAVPPAADPAPSVPVPDGISRIGDTVLRGRVLETWEAAQSLLHAIDLWDIWLLTASPENAIHTCHACHQENMAKLALDTLFANRAPVPSFRGRSVEEVRSWFPEVPRGAMEQERDAEFIQHVRAAMPRLRDLQDELATFIDRVAEAPFSTLTLGGDAEGAADQGRRRGTPPAVPWEGDDWDALAPQVRRLLRYMHGKERADLADLCPIVWERDCADVSGSALHSAVHKANRFLGQREQRVLEKVRGEPVLRWT
jgi:hypothetical protein